MSAILTLTDLSRRERFGCKGPRAEQWLTEHGFAPPEAPNTWTLNAQGTMIARLGTGEFLIEAIHGGAEPVRSSEVALMSLATVSAGTYWVPRQDTVLSVAGDAACELLLECCSFNFGALLPAVNRSGGPLVLTSMIGVAVMIVPEHVDTPRFTIWCDPSFGSYLSSTLLDLISNSATLAAAVSGQAPNCRSTA